MKNIEEIMMKIVMLFFGVLLSVNLAMAGGDHAHSHGSKKSENSCIPEHAAMGHCKMSDGGHGHASKVGAPALADKATKVIRVDMLDTMRFVFKDEFEMKEGDIIRFEVTNKGKIRHEFSIGDEQDQRAHAEVMMKNPDMVHGDDDAAITVDPGKTKSLTWQFKGEGEVVFACTLPGHYQAGMLHRQNLIK